MKMTSYVLLYILQIYPIFSSCTSDEFLLQNSVCTKCSDYVQFCSSCTSGLYSAISNASFESPVISSFWVYLSSLPGWNIQSGKRVELNNQVFASPQSGNQYIQLSEDVNYFVTQNLVTEPGYLYEIQFYYSAWPGKNSNSNKMQFYWGSNSDTVSPSGIGLSDSNWILYSSVIEATASTTQVKLQGIGTGAANHGGFVDSVTYLNLPKCSACEDGYYLDLDVCESCQDYDPNCILCDVTICLACADGFFLESGSCLACPNTCTICSDLLSCNSCIQGHYVDLGACVKCPSQCSECSSPYNCSECAEDYILWNGRCEWCQQSCLDCSEFLECLKCEERYFLIGGRCSECDERCLSCSSSDMCLECKDGFFLKEGYCKNCFHTCSKCSSAGECSECNEGFFLIGNRCECPKGQYIYENGCNECEDPNCLECTAKNNCSVCKTNFEINLGICELPEQEDKEEVTGEEAGDFCMILGLVLSTKLSILSGNGTSMWSFLNISIIIYFSPLMRTGMTIFMKDFCQSFGTNLLGLIPNFGKIIGLTEESYSKASEDFQDYGIDSTSFLLNSGETLIPFFAVLSLLPFLALFYCVHPTQFMKRRLENYRWNFFLRSWVQMFVEILVNSFLSTESISSSDVSSEQFVCLLILLLGFLSPFLLFYCTVKYKDALRSQRFKNYSSLFEEFKTDKGVLAMNYYVLFFSRRLLYVLGIFLFKDIPLVQVIINVCFTFVIIAYLLSVKPYKRVIDLIFSLASEICLLLVFILSGLCLLDNTEEEKNILEYCFLGTILGYFCLIVVMLIIQCIRVMKKKYRRRHTRVTVIGQGANNSTITTDALKGEESDQTKDEINPSYI